MQDPVVGATRDIPAATLRRPLLWTLLLAALLALSFQGARGLWGPDEGRYSNIGLQMLESGDWLTPRRHPEHAHFAKPPLTYWAIAASVAVFGPGEASLRLPNALAFLATVGLLVLLGRRLVPAAPWLPALVFATSLVPFGAANLINTDYLLTAFETLAMLGGVYVLQARDPREARRGRLLLWAGFGLAFMTKGPPGLLPLLPLLVCAWTLPRPHPRFFDLPSLGLFVAIALPWYIAVVLANPGLLGYFIEYEVYGRVFTDVHDRNARWYGALRAYGPVLLLGMLPWSWTLMRRIPGLPRGAAAWRAWWAARAPEDRLLLLWFLLPLAVFCLARSRLPLYLLPLMVPLALLIARRWRIEAAAERARVWRIALLSAAALLALKSLLPVLGAHAKDTRALAAQVRRLYPDLGEVVFIDESALYGLRYYLGVPVERVSLAAHRDPSFDSTLFEELAEDERYVFITTSDRLDRIAAALRPSGQRFVVGTRFERYAIGTIE